MPHLTAATLMRLADRRAVQPGQGPLLRLAAGGFRDMTRIAAGHPGIWPDICAENQAAIVAELDELMAALGAMREVVAAGDRDALVGALEGAREARLSLPTATPAPRTWPSCGCPSRTARASWPASPPWPPSWGEPRRHRDRPLGRGREGVLILLVDAATATPSSRACSPTATRPSLRALT
ncbi:MAG: prephenate dehydrogenase dimerization domain-containing protein [Microthrixaceae bacterium]